MTLILYVKTCFSARRYVQVPCRQRHLRTKQHCTSGTHIRAISAYGGATARSLRCVLGTNLHMASPLSLASAVGVPSKQSGRLYSGNRNRCTFANNKLGSAGRGRGRGVHARAQHGHAVASRPTHRRTSAVVRSSPGGGGVTNANEEDEEENDDDATATRSNYRETSSAVKGLVSGVERGHGHGGGRGEPTPRMLAPRGRHLQLPHRGSLSTFMLPTRGSFRVATTPHARNNAPNPRVSATCSVSSVCTSTCKGEWRTR